MLRLLLRKTRFGLVVGPAQRVAQTAGEFLLDLLFRGVNRCFQIARMGALQFLDLAQTPRLGIGRYLFANLGDFVASGFELLAQVRNLAGKMALMSSGVAGKEYSAQPGKESNVATLLSMEYLQWPVVP